MGAEVKIMNKDDEILDWYNDGWITPYWKVMKKYFEKQKEKDKDERKKY